MEGDGGFMESNSGMFIAQVVIAVLSGISGYIAWKSFRSAWRSR